ncbi:MAG: nodulation protein NfeD [Proteobacteria bacterium]|nr:nodulation protein NfeD [Pseudomonadota bacterium]
MRWVLTLLVLALGLAMADRYGSVQAATAPVVVQRIDGAIGPATAELVEHGLRDAKERGAALLVLAIDTPGGLDTSMRSIIKGILASPVPVACYVSPSGARAASAGTYILYACHVAAMAPATTLGSATPIAIGGSPSPAGAASGAASQASGDPMEAKRIGDAVAYIRGLAQLRERNAAWAERAVREAVSLPAGEALKAHVVDAVASDLPSLLQQIDGRVVSVQDKPMKLAVARAPVVELEVGWRSGLLALISSPDIALALMALGFYGLLFEMASPGAVLPGVMGGLALLVGLFGLQMLPISGAGLALVLLGFAFLGAEVFVPSHGALGVGGTLALGLGLVMLIDRDVAGFGIPPWLIATVLSVSVLFVALVATMSMRARRRPVVSGDPAMIDAAGEVLEADGSDGWAAIGGERWRIHATGRLVPGERVRVTGKNGLTLEVTRLSRSP